MNVFYNSIQLSILFTDLTHKIFNNEVKKELQYSKFSI